MVNFLRKTAKQFFKVVGFSHPFLGERLAVCLSRSIESGNIRPGGDIGVSHTFLPSTSNLIRGANYKVGMKSGA